MSRFRDARDAQIERKIRRAAHRTPAGDVYINANGMREVREFSARGFEVVSQDPSLRGLAVRQFLMRRVAG